MKTQSIRTATTTLLLLSNHHTTRRIVSAAAFFSSSVLLLARAFSSSSSSSSVFARSLRITHHSSCHHHHRWSFLSTRGGSGSVASPTLSSYLSSSASTSLSSTIISSTTPMDQVRASASAKTAAEKLIAMRGKMEEYGVDVYLVPSDDPHLSEYVPAAYMRRGYLTNFHGSAGTALVMSTGKAYLWTDSRYFNEAALSLDPEHWILMRQNEVNVPTIAKFLVDAAIEHYARNAGIPLRVGLDAYVHSSDFAKELTDAFVEGAKDVLVIDDDREFVNGHDRSVPPVIAVLETLDGKSNIVDSIWDGRPALPKNPFVVHPIEYAGLSVADKVDKIRAEMKDRKATLVVFGALDDIAYLFNVRCMNDVETCPVGIAYATISRDVATLYCDDEKVTPADVAMHLLSSNVVVRPYEDVVEDVRAHLRSDPTKSKVWLDGSRSNYALGRVIPIPNRIDAQNPIAVMKSVKNDAEMEGMRRAHIVDGAAMAEFMAWLEHAIVIEGRSDVSEVEVDLVLTGCRAKQPGFKEVSFPTIAGCGSNGAIVHYRAAFGSDLLKYVSKTAPILIDSGGQYEYGTTDVTRTWFFGDTPSDDFKEAYTRVLKGNIGVDTMIFPENTPGFVLDVFARKALWEVGLDYGHGTGHGVGAALNVHEGPHSISPRWLNKEVLKRGMVTSNEPGYYEDGNFGVRIENLLEIVDANPPTTTNGDDAETAHPPVAKKQRIEGGGKKFLKFTRLTQIPIQKDLIKLDIMTKTELDWLDAYHEEVLKKVAPLLEEGSPSMKWLVKSCEKIERH